MDALPLRLYTCSRWRRGDGVTRTLVSRAARAAQLVWKYRGNPGAVFDYLRAHGLRGTMERALDTRAQFFGDMLIGLDVPPVALQPPAGPFDPAAMTVNWIIPRFAPGWGGMMNAFRLAHHLESLGHLNVFWIHNPNPAEPSPEPYRQMIAEHFQPLRRHQVHYLEPGRLDRVNGDALIATDYTSAYWARGIAGVRRRFYLIQDHEPDFHPAGYPALYARQTYRFGFDALCNGAWLHRLARETYGMWSAQWEQAADPLHYHPPLAVDPPRRPGHIAFYARFETPRRAVPLGLLAFEILHARGIAFHVDFFGGPPAPIPRPYAHTDHGVLDAAALGRLYRQMSLGMVFSATNYSIIPREMMACGLPVVELEHDSARLSLGAAAVLTEPDPVALADTLQALLADEPRRTALGAAGIAFASRFSWADSGEVVARALVERIAAAAEVP